MLFLMLRKWEITLAAIIFAGLLLLTGAVYAMVKLAGTIYRPVAEAEVLTSPATSQTPLAAPRR